MERIEAMNIKIENWNGHDIRFVERMPGEWWAVAVDVAVALDYSHTPHMLRMLDSRDKGVLKVDTLGGSQKSAIVSELGIYDAVFGSHKPEAKEFKRWVAGMLKTLREASGLEGFQVFRMLDKEHQKEAMRRLRDSLGKPVRVDFIKANTIANKAVSSAHGYPRMLKKDQMTPDMLARRQPILDDTVTLMAAKDSFGLDLSVSGEVYRKYLS